MAYFEFKEKKIYFEETGEGSPLIFLHGNTASSAVFRGITELFKGYWAVLIDFSGYGKSERLESFPADLWYEEALQVIGLLEHLKIEQADLLGSSGGALAALNAALERPELVNKVLADSFLYNEHLRAFARDIIQSRETAKKYEAAREFYRSCHGEDWEKVIDNDTEAIHQYYRQNKQCFHKPVETLRQKVLITCSREDQIVRPDIYPELLKKIPEARLHVFEKGGHPAILSNAEEYARIARQFLGE